MEADVEFLLIEREAQRLIAEFARASDDGRYDDLLEFFDAAATYRVGDVVLQGRHAIGKRVSVRTTPPRRGKHLYTNIIVTLHGDRVRMESDFVYIQLIEDQFVCRSIGRVIDILSQTKQGLRILDHEVVPG